MMKWCAGLVFAIGWGVSAVGAQTTPAASSASLTKELVSLLEQHHLQSIAARPQSGEDVFVAALYIPKSELLAVSAHYTVPVLLQEQIYAHKYQEAYADLNSSGSKTGKLFVEDLGADGLMDAPGPDGRFDIIYQEITRRTLLNGNWKEQQLSADEYHRRFEAADGRYARALTAMIAEVRKLP
jgi:hypothetical protein